MKFKDFNKYSLTEKIQSLKNGDSAFCFPVYGTSFTEIHPKLKEVMELKKDYKPNIDFSGLVTIVEEKLKDDKELVQKVENKLKKIGMSGMNYYNTEGSLKLHLNLNGIGEIDDAVILGLIKILSDESEAENNMSFSFKIINPELHKNIRFKDTDQITIYFDKYSSMGDILNLSEKVEKYLLDSGVEKNKIERGPKDSFGFNSFVSARFDTNKLMAKYDEYPFFDKELKKFFESYKDHSLDHMPICVFEAVFNHLLFSEDINIPDKNELHDEDSKKVQIELEKAFNNPKRYFHDQGNEISDEQLRIKKETEKKVDAIFKEISKFKPDFSACNSVKEIGTYLKEQDSYLTQLVTNEEFKKQFLRVDVKIFELFINNVEDKRKELNELAAIRQNELSVAIRQNNFFNKFEFLLKKFGKKADDLLKEEPKTKGEAAKKLHSLLVYAYEDLKNSGDSKESYANFKVKCIDAINNARPDLAKHRELTEVILNLLAGIASLGIVPTVMFFKNNKSSCFFKVATDSVNKVNEMQQFIEQNEPQDNVPDSGKGIL